MAGWTSNDTDHVTNGVAVLSLHDDENTPLVALQAAAIIKDEEAHAKAREHGWVAPQAFNYGERDGQTGVHPGEEGLPEWAHQGVKYEWKEEYGDVGPKIPELEEQLFRSELTNRQGLKFENLLAVKVVAEAHEKPNPINDFHHAGLHPALVETIDMCNYTIPTPIQAYTVPAVLKGFDVIATAQTGSGKTAAFLIPCISKMMGKAKKYAGPRPNVGEDFTPAVHGVRAEPLILVVAPTRELCCQIFDEARRLCYRSMLRPCVAYGGGPKREQLFELAKGCDILVATPGRLIDIMENHAKSLSLSRVRFTIVDEADEMLQGDWEEDMSKIMSGGDANEDADHRYLLFSATFDKHMRKLAKKYLANDHVRVRIGRTGSVHENILQHFVWVENDMKKKALYDLLMAMPPSRTLVFVNGKKTVDYVDDFLFNHGLPTTSIHADRTQREREDALRAFRSGRCPILIATGVSARGLDVRNVMHVINYDIPSSEHGGIDEYVHRIGRTARIGNEGLSTSFYNARDEPLAMSLVKHLIENKQEIPEFLAQYKPEGDDLEWNDDSGVESEAEATGEDAWGAGNNDGDAWGSAPAEETAPEEDKWAAGNNVEEAAAW